MDRTKEEQQILQSCYDLMRDMEKRFPKEGFQESDLEQLTLWLKSLALSHHKGFEKLSLIPEHLHSQMSLRHFLNFLVPVERLVGRALSDEAILIHSEDRPLAFADKVPLYFVLDNIRSAFNVGSIFRLADCMGVEKIYLCGYTPTPDQETLQKTALGTTEATAWEHKAHLSDALSELKNNSVACCALETTSSSRSLMDIQFKGPTALIVGNERFGLESTSLQLCDQILAIPTYGVKNSLNVANALSMAAFEWRRQWS